MANSRPSGDLNTFLALIGHVCLQWALLEHTLLYIIAVAENMPDKKAFTYFGSTDIRARLGIAILLTHDANWPPTLHERLKSIRKALGKDGENLLWRRNQAVHGVHKSSAREDSFSLTVPRERGSKREMDVSIADLRALVTRLGELVADANSVLEEYGQWKFGTGGEQGLGKNLAEARPSVWIVIAHNLKRAIKRLFANK